MLKVTTMTTIFNDENYDHISEELLENVFEQMKRQNRNHVDNELRLHRGRLGCTKIGYFESENGQLQTYGAHSFLLFRNAFDPIGDTARELFSIGRALHLSRSTAFKDNSNTASCLTDYERQLLPQNCHHLDVRHFDRKINRLTRLGHRFDSLYLQLLWEDEEEDEEVDWGEDVMSELARTLCLAACLMLASKLHSIRPCRKPLPKLGRRLRRWRREVDRGSGRQSTAVAELLTDDRLLETEAAILETLNFDLSAATAPVREHLETLLLVLVRQVTGPARTAKDCCPSLQLFLHYQRARIRALGLRLVEGYLLYQVPFLRGLVQKVLRRPSSGCTGNKLLLGAFLLAAACWQVLLTGGRRYHHCGDHLERLIVRHIAHCLLDTEDEEKEKDDNSAAAEELIKRGSEYVLGFFRRRHYHHHHNQKVPTSANNFGGSKFDLQSSFLHYYSYC
ncbi:hypothetical protein TYRP_006771 [Tyrophagus putrescentiae]|nr:hypothetical protein TYRP_006771 [Tyrophagus putrescentiae]